MSGHSGSRPRLGPAQKAYWIAKGVGWDNVPRRVWQAYLRRSGTLRRRLQPAAYDWSQFPNRHASEAERQDQWAHRRQIFFAIPTSGQLHALVAPQVWQASVADGCTAAVSGRYPMFSHWSADLGWPPDFNRDPVNHIDWPVGPHWLETTRSGPPRDDIKLVWEASRWSLVFELARQVLYSGDVVWAERMWEFIEAWIAQNPVQQTVAWGCGQEVAFRLMALLTGVMTVSELPCSTPQRLAQAELLCWQSAKRIEANLNYARSQENNHALSEAVGLWTVGLLFPEFPEASRWIAVGRRTLEEETQRQIYDDGSYVQHSMSYHRVMLDDLCWAIQLGRQQSIELSAATLDKLAAATQWLSQFVDPQNGRVPNYGSNDGANILPLACGDYLDYRPTLQMAAEVSGVSSGLAVGPWSEKPLWLTGKLPQGGLSSDAPLPRPATWHAPQGGYYVLRGPHSYVMTRATTYRDRPGQCDMLHVDLWYRGINVFRDAGSYRYYHADPAVKGYYYSVAAHNTLQVGQAEQMTKGPNFLWFHWPRGRAEFVSEQHVACVAEVHADVAYQHYRDILRDGDNYTIIDRVEGAEEYTVRWRLAPECAWQLVQPTQLEAALPDGGTIRVDFVGEPAAGMQVTLGESWESLHYAQRSKCPAVCIDHLRGKLETRVSVS